MKNYILLLFIGITSIAHSQNRVAMSIDEPTDCGELQQQVMSFLVDGSFQSSTVVFKEVNKLKTCGLDDHDVRFFGRIEVLSTLLKKMTQDKLIDNLTYGDLMLSITDMKQTANYNEAKRLALLSQQLAETKADIRTWEEDLLLFNQLGASQAIKDKVYKYLREHPDNELTYQELLIKLKK